MAIFGLDLNPRRDQQLPLLAAGLASIAVIIAFRISSSSSIRTTKKLIPSPRATLLPNLSEREIKELPYPPDILPGARDATSPYGTIRVYEWGPEEGRKVLLVHGISTPCIALGGVAHGLVNKGCRVMLIDLFGRGYSDTPSDLPHDARLYASEILIALTSSNLSWTGGSSGRFSLIGYSLGGGIAAAFTSSFPHLVSSLILLAPAGLLRPNHISTASKLLYSTGLMPESLLEFLVRRRLEGGPPSLKHVKTMEQNTAADAAVEEELPKQESLIRTARFENTIPQVTVAAAVQWQLKFHQGFIKSFMSSIRYGPITEQHRDWARIGQRLVTRNVPTNKTPEDEGLQNSKVLIICGEHDSIIIKDEVVEDAARALQENVDFRFVDAGHEFPITKSEEVVKYIADFWSVPC